MRDEPHNVAAYSSRARESLPRLEPGKNSGIGIYENALYSLSDGDLHKKKSDYSRAQPA